MSQKKMFPVILGGSEPTDVFSFLDSVVYISELRL